MNATTRTEVLALLLAHGPALAHRYALASLGVFGSVARGEQGPGSDVDVLVSFAGPTRFDTYFGLKDEMEELLGRPVDLVTDKGLKPRARALVDKDLIRVA